MDENDQSPRRGNDATGPINGPEQARSETGFLIFRLKPDRTINSDMDLALKSFSLDAQPLIDSHTVARLRELEESAAEKKFAPRHRLSDYWRVDVRHTPERLDEIEETLRRLPDVDLIYRERTVSDPVMPNDDVYSNLETFLDPAPIGIDARWVWTQSNGDGSGMHFIDLEQGWIIGHEDLPAPTVIFNQNIDGKLGVVGNHGTAVLGIVAGVDNAKGVIGIAPNVKTVRVVSHWNIDPAKRGVAKALAAAILAQPPPHVILIETQTDGPYLPVETDAATFDAIRLAVSNGIVVVEAAANGNQNLDTILDEDSGAILVGAGTAQSPHNRWLWGGHQGSNFGSRVHCYAWGDSIVSAGYGDLGSGSGKYGYTKVFRGTSGASAIIAGCALLLQGLHVAAHGSPMLPEQMRDLLSNPDTGTAQGTAVPGHIGVMPDLKKIVENM
jgi:subtilisin family serine protease